jgi:hypothetical protein
VRNKDINSGRGNMSAWATALSVGVLVLGLGACQRERAQMDTESAANTPATTTPAPTTPADTTGTDTANTTETPNTNNGSDVTAEAPMDNSNPTGNTANPPPPVSDTDITNSSGAKSTEPPMDQTDTDEAQTPQQR